MADITVYNQGQVSDEGKVNWRGDQVTVTPGNQSIYDSSSVQLADLGSRKVVGDRVFRYAKANATINSGEIAQGAQSSLLKVTAGGTNGSGGKTFTFYFATSNAAGVYDEGMILCQSGTAANKGQMYRIKTQPIVATTSNATLVLYDPLKITENVTDSWDIFSNPYMNVTQHTAAAGTGNAVGVAPITVTTGDYFWLQTWGPVNMKAGVGVGCGFNVAAGATGQCAGVTVVTGTVSNSIGYSMQVLTVSEHGLVFLQIAP